MGNVRTEQIKRTAKELIKRFPERFSTDFEKNKHTVNQLIRGGTSKVRNQVAGYITRSFVIEKEALPDETLEETGEDT